MNDMFLHDTHLHLDLFKDMSSIMKKIETNKSYTIAVTNLPELYKKYSSEYKYLKYIRFALGFHPELITKYSYQMEIFDEEIQYARYIGEIGLDKTRNTSDYEKQKILFEHIINECQKSGGKILSIHSRNSVSDILEIISQDFNCKVIMHWFSGNIDELLECIDRGFYFSINIKMINTKKGRKIIDNIPIDRILMESDEPLASGNNNYQFLFMKEIAEFISNSKNIEFDDVSYIFKNNLKKLLE